MSERNRERHGSVQKACCSCGIAFGSSHWLRCLDGQQRREFLPHDKRRSERMRPFSERGEPSASLSSVLLGSFVRGLRMPLPFQEVLKLSQCLRNRPKPCHAASCQMQPSPAHPLLKLHACVAWNDISICFSFSLICFCWLWLACTLLFS